MTRSVRLDEADLRAAIKHWLESQGMYAKSVNLGMDTEDRTNLPIFYASAEVEVEMKTQTARGAA